MSLKSYIMKNKIFTIITSAFVLWILFLLIAILASKRTITFYDALGQTDVSSNYISVLPILRYVFEPFAAISFILEMEFTWMFLFFMIYPVLRIGFYYLEKSGRFQSQKYKLLKYIIIDFINFTFKIYIIALGIVLLIILIGYSIQGFFFVSRYFMIPIQIAVYLCTIIMIFKVILILLKLLHPRLKFKFEPRIKKRISLSLGSKIRKELVYLIGIGCILLGSNIVLISTQFPSHRIMPSVPLSDNEVLLDFHVHTVYSDGWLTPEERVMWYIDHGIDAAFFTDHDNIRGALAARTYVEENNLNFTVFIGEEWTDHENDIHINYFGLEEEIVPLESYTSGGPLAMNASELISYVKLHGGYITVNHYNYDSNPQGGFGVPYSLETLRDWGVDGFEIVNGGSYSGKYQQIRQFCMDNNLTCIGGSDTHTNEDLNTFIKLTLDDPNNFTVDNIFKNLRNNTHEVVAINFYPKLVDFPGDLNDAGFYIIEEFINYIFNIDVFQGLSWILWSTGIYVLFLLTYRKLKNVDLEHLKQKIY